MNLMGQRFGKLVVDSDFGRNKRREILWKCVCDCGNTSIIKTSNLISSKTKSCGCIPTGSPRKDASGEVYGRLTVESFSHRDENRRQFYRCRCQCGNTIVTTISSLRRSKVRGIGTRSCGCLKREVERNRYGKMNPNWKEEKTDEEREMGRFIPGYKEWCFAVKEKDGFRCRVCGSTKSGMLRSHHLKNYGEEKDARLDVNNGACMCVICHVFFHKIFGYTENSKDQFEKLISMFSALRGGTL